MKQNQSYLSDYILCCEEFIDPKDPSGLWWCKDFDDVLAIQINAVAKPEVTSWDEMSRLGEFIHEFPFVFVVVPSGKEQDTIVNELLLRFKLPVYVPNDEAWVGCQSAKELREKGGIKAVQRLLYGCKEIPIAGLLNIADIKDEEPIKRNRTFSGIPFLDRATGGFSGGELSIWTGKRGEGKSTLLSQIIPEAVAVNQKVCVYSGEMPSLTLKSILYQQIAGTRNILTKIDPVTGKELYLVKDDAIQRINKWLNNRVFITDIKKANAHDEDNILSLFEYAYMRYRCRVFMVDNIMTTALKEEIRLGQWRAQSQFASKLTAFAQRYDVHVHLVAHPRKTRDGNFEADDVGGSSDITNKADNVFRVGRVPDEKLAETGYSAGIQILKNRRYGERSMVKMDFDPVCRRFYPAGGSAVRKFDWEV